MLLQCFRRLQDLLRPGAHPIIFGEVEPAHGAGGIHQKLRRTRYVLPVNSGAGVNQVIAANRLSPGVRKKSECVSGFLAKVTADFRAVNTDRDRPNACLMKLLQTLLNAPQLGVARWSPVTPVEN